MDSDVRLPIKIVLPRDQEFQRPEGGGGGFKVFGEVTQEARDALDFQVGEVDAYFRETFRQTALPAVARVTLKPKALAKSHRPTELFDERTCPIIGVGGFGELYVSARPAGLQGLSSRIRQLGTKQGVANISTINEIRPYKSEDALGPHGVERIQRRLEEGDRNLKVRLFQHHEARLDDALLQGFFEHAARLRLPRPEPVRARQRPVRCGRTPCARRHNRAVERTLGRVRYTSLRTASGTARTRGSILGVVVEPQAMVRR